MSGSGSKSVDIRTEIIEVRMSIPAAGESTAKAAPVPAGAECALDRLLPAGGALTGRVFNRLLGEAPDEVPLPPGTRVGAWRLERLLGCGGSALVYLAGRADADFEQEVAIKIARADARLVEPFRRERQILARLGHPSIARLIDGGTCDEGRPWFAMEAVLGERIDHYARNRRLRLRDRLALFEQVCEAVAYAHARGFVHRDIKPGNVLVDEIGRARLLDFGIAVANGEGDDGVYRAMTPIYASPEQRTGAAVTTASDIYQLGMLLGAIVMPDDAPTTRWTHFGGVDAVRAVIARATAREPACRFPSVAALRADIVAIRHRRLTTTKNAALSPGQADLSWSRPATMMPRPGSGIDSAPSITCVMSIM
jgi:eukaryotic-like serine/threonine-protein kinase